MVSSAVSHLSKLLGCGLICLLLCLFSTELFAAGSWIQDDQMHFKIQVPFNYQRNRMMDGTDVIHAFVSPDQNVAVRIRAFKVSPDVKIYTVINLFEQNIIAGAQRLLKDNYTLNTIFGKLCGYKWHYNNIPVGIAVFYTIQNGTAYVVWSMIPESIFNQRTPESDAIINTFTILNPNTTVGGGLFNTMTGKVQQNQQENTGNVHHSATGSPGYFDLISDDARIAHRVPNGFRIDNKTPGQTIWKNSAGIKMVIQTISSQGPFKPYMEGVITDIKQNGATVLDYMYSVENGLTIANYAYRYGDAYFAYGAAPGYGVYYLVGFVGKKNQATTLNEYSEAVNLSLKKVK